MARWTQSPGSRVTYSSRLVGNGWDDDEFDPDAEATRWSIYPSEGAELSNRVVDGTETTISVSLTRRGLYTLTVHYTTIGGEVDSRFTTIECKPVPA